MREMKDSGIQWIGRMPEHWNVYPIKSIILQNDGGIWGEDPDDNVNNTIVLRSTEQTVDGKWDIIEPAQRDLTSISNADYYRCIEGDLLITKSSGSDLHIGKTTIVDENVEKMKCCYSNFIQRIRVDRSYEPRLIWYLFNSSIVREQFVYMQNSTSGIGNLNAKYIAELRVPLPGKKEQNCIINYLDEKCAKIDAIIEKQQEIIEKLKEYKLSIISEAVTKGLDPDVKMKDSGIKWIKKIPSSWTVTSLSNGISLVQTGPFGSQLHSEDYIENGDLYLINPANIVNGQIVPDCNVSISLEKAYELKQHILEVGDIVFGRRGEMGRCACVEDDGNRYFCGTGCIKLKCNERLDAHFLILYLQTSYIRQYLELNSVGTTMANLNSSIISKIPIVYPIIEEQKEIAKYISEKCEQIDKKIYLQETMIRKEMQYKQSIIYEVITGKREV